MDDRTTFNYSHRDSSDVGEVFEAVLDSRGLSKSEWMRQVKRDWLVDEVDGLPDDLADDLADDFESRAEERDTEAAELRARADELEDEADDLRETAEQIRDLDEVDLSTDDEDESNSERDQLIARLGDQVAQGVELVLRHSEEVNRLAEMSDDPRTTGMAIPDDWYEDIRDEICEQSGIAPETAPIEIRRW